MSNHPSPYLFEQRHGRDYNNTNLPSWDGYGRRSAGYTTPLPPRHSTRYDSAPQYFASTYYPPVYGPSPPMPSPHASPSRRHGRSSHPSKGGERSTEASGSSPLGGQDAYPASPRMAASSVNHVHGTDTWPGDSAASEEMYGGSTVTIQLSDRGQTKSALTKSVERDTEINLGVAEALRKIRLGNSSAN
jgi:hypothetical protein